MPHSTDPNERAMLDRLQRQLDSIARLISYNRTHPVDPWQDRERAMQLGTRLQDLMESTVIGAASAHRSEAFLAEYCALVELVWVILQTLDTADPIDWDAELAELNGDQR